MVEECSSWDLVSDVDLWESDALDQEGYVVVKQEDIVDGIACFMAAYLLSLKETKVHSEWLSFYDPTFYIFMILHSTFHWFSLSYRNCHLTNFRMVSLAAFSCWHDGFRFQ